MLSLIYVIEFKSRTEYKALLSIHKLNFESYFKESINHKIYDLLFLSLSGLLASQLPSIYASQPSSLPAFWPFAIRL